MPPFDPLGRNGPTLDQFLCMPENRKRFVNMWISISESSIPAKIILISYFHIKYWKFINQFVVLPSELATDLEMGNTTMMSYVCIKHIQFAIYL